MNEETTETVYVMIERGMLERIKALATRLHSENRMNGDEMRDAGHLLTAVVEAAIDVPDEGVLPSAAEACRLHGLTR